MAKNVTRQIVAARCFIAQSSLRNDRVMCSGYRIGVSVAMYVFSGFVFEPRSGDGCCGSGFFQRGISLRLCCRCPERLAAFRHFAGFGEIEIGVAAENAQQVFAIHALIPLDFPPYSHPRDRLARGQSRTRTFRRSKAASSFGIFSKCSLKLGVFCRARFFDECCESCSDLSLLAMTWARIVVHVKSATARRRSRRGSQGTVPSPLLPGVPTIS